MKLSEEMKRQAKIYDNIPLSERPTAVYGISVFIPKVEQLEKENDKLKEGLKLFINEIEKGDLIEKERTHWFWLKFDEIKQLLEKIKG